MEGHMDRIDQLPEFEELQRVRAAYEGVTLESLAAMEDRVTVWRYGKGARMLHRGYYCPSLVQDIVNGNAKRGKLLGHLRAGEIPECRYGLDSEGRPVCAETEFDIEWILYEGQRQIGLTFSKRTGAPEALSVCCYDDRGQLVSYLYGYAYSQDCKPSIIWAEGYRYGQDRMDVTLSDYLQYGRELLTRQWRYCFALKGGALSSYYRVSLGPKREIPVTMTRSVLRKIG